MRAIAQGEQHLDMNRKENPKEREILSDLEEERYFAVLIAYDFQPYVKQRRFRELWVTRISVSNHDIDFTKALPAMAKAASYYFGEDSHGLQHIPEWKVIVGEPESLGEVQKPQK